MVNLNDYVKFSTCHIRCAKSYKVWKPFACTNILKFSFWHKYNDELNSLPKDVIEATNVSNFKHLHELLIRDSVSH